jgi:iron(III) transport system permease protein
MSVALGAGRDHGPVTRWAGRTRRRRSLLAPGAAVLVVAGLLVPVAFLFLEATQAGWSEVFALVDRPIILGLAWNTVRLALAVTAIAAVLGTSAAWLTERTDLPFRRVLATALVLPLAVPDFVTAWTWSSIFPGVHGYAGAVLVMSLGLYPLVYLPVAAALRSADPSLEDVARALGLSRLRTFVQVTLRQVRSTVLGGSLLVCLALLAEYGAFEDLRFETFTTAIFTELQVGFATADAAGSALVLVGLSAVVLVAEAAFRERGRLDRGGLTSLPPLRRHHLGGALPGALAFLLALVGLALAFPLGVVAYWLATGGSSTLPATVSVAGAAGYSALYSALGALGATVLALPVAFVAVRRPARWTAALERSAFVLQALAGLVVALALVFFTERYLPGIYESPELLVAAYSMIFFPLALVAVRTSVARVPVRLEEVARSLGAGPLRARVRVTLPLVAPGLAAAFCLVFLSGVTELTATLLLVPNNVETLATQFWAFTENVSYGAAAPYAATMILLSVVPGFLLSRVFDRQAARGAGS